VNFERILSVLHIMLDSLQLWQFCIKFIIAEFHRPYNTWMLWNCGSVPDLQYFGARHCADHRRWYSPTLFTADWKVQHSLDAYDEICLGSWGTDGKRFEKHWILPM